MAEFILNTCANQKSDMVAESQQALGLVPQGLYQDPEAIAQLALEVKQRRNQTFCMLPFCHTLEAEMLGGNINLGDETAGARAAAPICDSVADVLDLQVSESTSQRFYRMLDACRLLVDKGEHVMFCITGPVSILTCLVESRTVFKEWRKNPEAIHKVLAFLSGLLVEVACKAASAGACAIEYADPPAASSIVGPKFAASLYEEFTRPFIQELAERLPTGVALYLCPLSATKDMQGSEEGSGTLSLVAKCPKAIKGL